VPVIASLLLFCLLQPTAPPPPLRIDLVFVGSIPPGIVATAMDEVISIWSPYHVDLHLSPADAVPEGSVRLAVVLAKHHDDHLPAATLGSIRFRNGMPEPTILMYSDTIDLLVAAAPEMRGDRECLPAVHNLAVGRAFGRALAHEIGHYLLRSRQHGITGLMRATHRTPDLIAPERQGFELSPWEAAQISEMTSLAHE